MANAKIKFIASQAKTIHLYRNTRSKLIKCNTNIYFNKQCLAKKVTPKYANLNFTNNSPAAQITTNKAQVLRLKNEIKFLFKKNEKLNQELQATHIKEANEWGNLWTIIQSSINDSLNHEMEQKYKSLDNKMNKLARTQNQKPVTKTEFFRRVVKKHKSDSQMKK
jgi:hypothetical protein